MNIISNAKLGMNFMAKKISKLRKKDIKDEVVISYNRKQNTYSCEECGYIFEDLRAIRSKMYDAAGQLYYTLPLFFEPEFCPNCGHKILGISIKDLCLPNIIPIDSNPEVIIFVSKEK